MPNLGKELENHLRKLKKVKLVRNLKRMGVTSARVLGFKNAKGPIIVSFDSHIEVIAGWLEPLLDRLKDAPKLTVWMNIYSINANDFEFNTYGGAISALGGLDFE